MVPSEKDRDKFYLTLSLLVEKYSADGMSESKCCSIIRTAIRTAWSQSDVRSLVLMNACVHDMDPTTRTKWLYECNHCKHLYKNSMVAVDHIKGEHSLKTFSDIENFARSILDVTIEDLQVLCNECHGIKTYSERYGVTPEVARIEKAAICWMDNNTVPEQKQYLIANGFLPSDVSNDKKRRNSYIILLNRDISNE